MLPVITMEPSPAYEKTKGTGNNYRLLGSQVTQYNTSFHDAPNYD